MNPLLHSFLHPLYTLLHTSLQFSPASVHRAPCLLMPLALLDTLHPPLAPPCQPVLPTLVTPSESRQYVLATYVHGYIYTILYYAILYYAILYYTILYYAILHYTILYYTIPYHTNLYYTIPYHTILIYTIPYHTNQGSTYPLALYTHTHTHTVVAIGCTHTGHNEIRTAWLQFG